MIFVLNAKIKTVSIREYLIWLANPTYVNSSFTTLHVFKI